jgi:hypothetical protein
MGGRPRGHQRYPAAGRLYCSPDCRRRNAYANANRVTYSYTDPYPYIYTNSHSFADLLADAYSFTDLLANADADLHTGRVPRAHSLRR